MNTILETGKLITPDAILPFGWVVWDENGIILHVGDRESIPTHTGTQVISADSLAAIPGLIDIHVHGGFGITFGLGDLENNLTSYSKKVSSHGVTGFVLTICGPDPDFIVETLEAYVPMMEKDLPGAQPHGFHLEGPFLNPEKHGAFNPDWLRNASLQEMRRFILAGKGWVKHVSLAPELASATEIASYLKENGVQAALGHSNTDFATASAALSGDFTHVTHTFNAQSSFHHREPGVVGAVLTSQHATAELIADGMHVHPAAMQVLLKCLGTECVCLITDAMPGAGLADGKYDLLGQAVEVKDGVARLPDGTFAGSTATLDQCLRNIIKMAGVNLQQAAKMASTNPAAVIGNDKMGILEPGKKADITLLDGDLQVKMTIRNGKIIYKE